MTEFENPYGHRGNEGLFRQGGWVDLLRSTAQDRNGTNVEKAAGVLARLLSEYWAPRSGKEERGDFIVDGGDSMSGTQSLLMEKLENAKTVMTKIFSLPLKAPFDVGERAFAIVDREADVGPVRRQDSAALRRRGEYDRASRDTASDGQNPGIKVVGTSGTGGEMGVLSVSPTGTYYIYAFDGRLLAEYNGLGICVRDYIYMGGKLIAEYRPQESFYFYYASDQIGSKRIVTDGTGAVVYAAAHDPWGGIQKTWVPTYDPALKFSGKERDSESGLDYFGARYYDHSLYRFLSVDPIIPAGLAISNPQRWNLYAYCGDNPMNYVDQDGRYPRAVHFGITLILALKANLPYDLALTIATANQAVDESIKTTSWNPLATDKWHFPDQQRLTEVYSIAYSTLDPVVLGKCLHVIQDSFSHRGYSLATVGHLFAGSYPDDMFRDLDLLSEMVDAVQAILDDYRRRLAFALMAMVYTLASIPMI